MFVLDTDIATLLLREHERVLVRVAKVEAHLVYLSLVTRLELIRGRIDAVIKASTADELLNASAGLGLTEEFVASRPIVTVTEAVAEQFDALRVLKKLNKMSAGDRLQAALALAHSATLVTRNTKDFAAVPNLKLDDWAD